MYVSCPIVEVLRTLSGIRQRGLLRRVDWLGQRQRAELLHLKEAKNFEPRSFRIGSAPILCDVLTETDVPRGVLSASSPSEVVSDDRCISG